MKQAIAKWLDKLWTPKSVDNRISHSHIEGKTRQELWKRCKRACETLSELPKSTDNDGPEKLYNLFTLILNDLKEYPWISHVLPDNIEMNHVIVLSKSFWKSIKYPNFYNWYISKTKNNYCHPIYLICDPKKYIYQIL